MHILPKRNHRVSGLEYLFFFFLGAPNDSNPKLICSSFPTLLPQPYSSCSKTRGSSLVAQTVFIKFKIPATSVLVVHNTRVCTETCSIFVLLWSQTKVLQTAGHKNYLYLRNRGTQATITLSTFMYSYGS